MKVKDLVNVVDFEATDNVKFFNSDTEDFTDILSLECFIENYDDYEFLGILEVSKQ